MKRQYKDLHKYQVRMVDWILANEKCALWAGVGLGKTVTTLTALEHLLDQKKVEKILIIAPLRVAKFVWPTEAEKWGHLNKIKTNRPSWDKTSPRGTPRVQGPYPHHQQRDGAVAG